MLAAVQRNGLLASPSFDVATDAAQRVFHVLDRDGAGKPAVSPAEGKLEGSASGFAIWL